MEWVERKLPGMAAMYVGALSAGSEKEGAAGLSVSTGLAHLGGQGWASRQIRVEPVPELDPGRKPHTSNPSAVQ